MLLKIIVWEAAEIEIVLLIIVKTDSRLTHLLKNRGSKTVFINDLDIKF